jgi:CHAD domain-containing protein
MKTPRISRDAQPNETIADSLEQRWKTFRKEFKKSRHALSEEAVHDTRVASRKVLSTLFAVTPVIGGKRARRVERNVEKALDSLSPLRDAQVELDEVAKLDGHGDVLRQFRGYLRRHERDLKGQARLSIRNVKSGKIKKDLRAIEKRLQRKNAGRRRNAKLLKRILRPIDESFNAVVRRRRHLDPTDVTTLHTLRVALKEYRYMLEALQQLLSGFDGNDLNRLKKLQDYLGELHDLEMLSSTLRDFVEDRYVGRPKAILPMQKRIIDRHHRLLNELLDRLDDILETWQRWSAMGAERVRAELRTTQ